MITDYEMIDGEPYQVNRSVSEWIRDGWQPYGDPLMVSFAERDGPPALMVQVMVKYEEVQPLPVYITNEVLEDKVMK